MYVCINVIHTIHICMCILFIYIYIVNTYMYVYIYICLYAYVRLCICSSISSYFQQTYLVLLVQNIMIFRTPCLRVCSNVLGYDFACMSCGMRKQCYIYIYTYGNIYADKYI